MHNFTQDDLVQLIYKEISPEKSVILMAAIQADWDLRDQYEALIAATKGLEVLNMSPRKIAVDNILNYAKRSVKVASTEV